MICGRGMSSDAGGRPEVKRTTGHPPAVCSRVWPQQQEKNDDRQLTNGGTCSWCDEEERSRRRLGRSATCNVLLLLLLELKINRAEAKQLPRHGTRKRVIKQECFQLAFEHSQRRCWSDTRWKTVPCRIATDAASSGLKLQCIATARFSSCCCCCC